MWHQPLLRGTMRPSADDSWVRLSLEIRVSFKWSYATRSKFPFAFNIFGVLVKRSPGEGVGYSPCRGVLLTVPEVCWKGWIRFYFMKCGTHEPTSVPSSSVASVPFP